MTIEFIHIFQSFIILFLIGILYFLRSFFKESKSRYRFKNFESYMTLLHYYMEKAYDIIHKDQLLIYSIEATRVNDENFNKAAMDFALLTRKMMGSKLTSEFVEFYGSEETFMFNMVEYFNNKYETDEIRESAVNNIMESEEEERPINETHQRNIRVI